MNKDCFREDLSPQLAAEIIPFEAQAWLPVKSRPATHPHKGAAARSKARDWKRVLPEETHGHLWKYFSNRVRPHYARDLQWFEKLKKKPPLKKKEKKEGRPQRVYSSHRQAHRAAVMEVQGMFLQQVDLWNAQSNEFQARRLNRLGRTTVASRRQGSATVHRRRPWAGLIDESTGGTTLCLGGNNDSQDVDAFGSQTIKGLRERLRDVSSWKFQPPKSEEEESFSYESSSDDDESSSDDGESSSDDDE